MSSNNSRNVINFVKNRKKNLVSVFHSHCCICGFNAYQEALEFHHINPKEKEFGLTSQTTTRALDKQLKEAKKCILLCSNCHKGIHAGKINLPNNPYSFFDEEVANQLLDELQQLKTHKLKHCKRCGSVIHKTSEYCLECRSLLNRKAERPQRDELKNLIRTLPFTIIASQYKVSDNAIRKWCKSENLPYKKTEIKKYSEEEWGKL